MLCKTVDCYEFRSSPRLKSAKRAFEYRQKQQLIFGLISCPKPEGLVELRFRAYACPSESGNAAVEKGLLFTFIKKRIHGMN
jgi:hypothetical protein